MHFNFSSWEYCWYSPGINIFFSKHIKNNELKFGSDNPNAIEVKELRKTYSGKKNLEEVKALDGISFLINLSLAFSEAPVLKNPAG